MIRPALYATGASMILLGLLAVCGLIVGIYRLLDALPRGVVWTREVAP